MNIFRNAAGKMVSIGVLALQGDFAKHMHTLQTLKAHAIEVRTSADLNRCSGLIIPGGESTTMLRQIEANNLKKGLLEFAARHPLFGTCAGLILMSKEVLNYPMQPLGLLDLQVERNAYGRQIESFIGEVDLFLEKRPRTMKGIFIRAPKIRATAPEVKILASYKDEPVAVQQGRHLACSFHPELLGETVLHKYFLDRLLA